MTGKKAPHVIGDAKIKIFIPSRYADGSCIPEERIKKTVSDIRASFAEWFGGCTNTGYDTQFCGAYRQFGGPLSGHVVDEIITIVWATVERKKFTSNEESSETKEQKENVFQLAAKVGAHLQQEMMAVEWIEELVLMPAEGEEDIQRLPFTNYKPTFQDRMVLLAILRLRSAHDMAGLLSLNNWTGCRENVSELLLIAEKEVSGKAEKRKAYVYPTALGRLSQETEMQLRGVLHDGDLLFAPEENLGFRIWLGTKDGVVGGRRFPFPGEDGLVSRDSKMLALAMLESSRALPLSLLVERAEMTQDFFKGYSSLLDRTTKEMEKIGIGHEVASREAQLLLGRIMFLRFLEAKKWLAEDMNFLNHLFENHSRQFYRKALEPLFFEILDKPEDRRKRDVHIPYINGGLFRASPAELGRLPDELFDPAKRDSIIGFFNRYEFSLDEKGSQNEEVSVDPSMFGHVLESLCSKTERKNKGVHYTPPEIARVLARKAIVSRLAEKLKLDEAALNDFAYGNLTALDDDESERVMSALEELRIVDPAVGSGSLLLGMLNELMCLLSRCMEKEGTNLMKGASRWGKEVRKFVTRSLFGVDVDPNAVEVTKLRLWLAIAVGDLKPLPLPNISYNIRVGDSLSEVVRPSKDELIESLPYTDLDEAKNQFIWARKEVLKPGLTEARQAEETLEQAERNFAVKFLLSQEKKELARQIAKGGPIPFNWHLHFHEVFEAENRGFDIVIANPPYVSAQNLAFMDKEVTDQYKSRFESMRSGAKDLYLAFVEQALYLAGKKGRIAYIMPNFSRTQSGKNLRRLLQERGAVEKFVDFGDLQVFPTATNYVALLFATAQKTKSKTFICYRPDRQNWPPVEATDWISESPSGKVAYGETWMTLSKEETGVVKAIESRCHTLGEMVEYIGVGVQTSADEVFLVTPRGPKKRSQTTVYSDFLETEVPLEAEILRSCAKGAAHIKPYALLPGTALVWPYDARGKLIPEKTFQTRFPLAWEYLKRCKPRLMKRSMGSSRSPECWWRFGREQGIELCGKPKILIPSLLKGGQAFYDEQGAVAFTASGKGGGGAWGLVPDPNKGDPWWLLAVLNSQVFWQWLELEGDPKKDGWRGVDQTLLKKAPVPVADSSTYHQIRVLVFRIMQDVGEGPTKSESREKLEAIVRKAYGILGKGKAERVKMF